MLRAGGWQVVARMALVAGVFGSGLVVSKGCSGTCELDLQCGLEQRCVPDPITGAKSCRPPCTSDGDCGHAGVVCADGLCDLAKPILEVDTPSGDLQLGQGVDAVSLVSGRVSFWGKKAKLKVAVRQLGSASCFDGVWEFSRTVEFENPAEGEFADGLPFQVEDLPVQAGVSALVFELNTVPPGLVPAKLEYSVTAPACVDCPTVRITRPASNTLLDGDNLVAEEITGTVSGLQANCATWRVVAETGESADGVWPLDGTPPSLTFGPQRLPLFPGLNRLVVEAGFEPRVGSCEITMRTPQEAAVALRVMLTWDSQGDMDTHLIRPGGYYASGDDCYYGNCQRTRMPWGNTRVTLDVDNTYGYGPENIRLSAFESGTYGVLIDAFSGQSTVTTRVYLGRTLVGTVGPCFIPAGQDLAVGVLNVSSANVGGDAFTPINQLLSSRPTTDPGHWLDPTEPYGPGVVATACPVAQPITCAPPATDGGTP
ncbi:MAG: hypothetical protein AB2A00_02165 [Myxococcota bacterium]